MTDVNSASVGIEIVNPGHEFGYRPFPDEQIAALIPLIADIKDRHGIGRGNVVGHSDVAPAARRTRASCSRGGSWPSAASRCRAQAATSSTRTGPTRGSCSRSSASAMTSAIRSKPAIAFQRRFRPDLIDGIIDGECRAKLLALLLPRPQ